MKQLITDEYAKLMDIYCNINDLAIKAEKLREHYNSCPLNNAAKAIDKALVILDQLLFNMK